MQLHLPIPAEWRQHEAAGRRWFKPHASDALTLVIDPMEPLPPLRQPAWLRERVRRDVPPGATLVVLEISEKTTRLGWPATVLAIQISEEATNRLIEQRITTLYQFQEYCVLAEMRARDLVLLSVFQAQLGALLEEGRPDWSGSDTSLTKLLASVER